MVGIDDFIKFLRGIVSFIKGAWKTLKFLVLTGFIFPAFVGILFIANPDMSLFWLIISFLPVLYLFIQWCCRKKTKDPKYSLFKAITGATASRSEKKLTDPDAPKEMKFDEPCGVVFGKKKKAFICRDEKTDGHILICGGPGSGKSSCLAVPSLMSWGQNGDGNDAIFAIDIKGELSQLTAKRRKNYKIFSLRPEDYGYNPFYCIDPNQNLIQQIRDIAIALCPIPVGTKDPFWKQSSQNFISAALLWAYHKQISFAEIMRLIKRTPPEELIEQILNDDIEDALLFANQFRNMPQETMIGVYGEVSNTCLVFATDEALIATLNKPKEKCILPSDLDGNMALYIQLDEYRLEQMKEFLTMLVNQFLKYGEKRKEQNSNRVLVLLDEFARLGRIDSICSGLATLRSKGFTIALIFQSLAQLDAIYGRDQRKVICDNCSYWAILKVSNGEDQKQIADNIGTYDKVKRSSSTNRGDFKTLGSSGVTISEEEKRIVKPEELGRLRDDLLLLEPQGFVRCRKTPYYNTPEFQVD